MPISDCIGKMLSAGLIKAGQVERLTMQTTRIRNKILNENPSLDSEAAADQASKQALKEMTENTTNNRRILELQSAKYKSNLDYVTNHPKGPVYAARQLVLHLDRKANAVYERAISAMGESGAGALERVRSHIPGGIDTLIGSRPKIIEDAVRYMWGDKTIKGTAADLGEGLRAGMDETTRRLSEAGIPISKIKNYDFVHLWSASKFIKASPKQLEKDWLQHLDLDKMLNPNGTSMTKEQGLETVLQIRNEMINAGRNSFTHAALGRSPSVDAARTLQFKNADSYIKMFKQYGKGNLLTNAMEQMRRNALDAAMADHLGPQYHKTWERVTQIANEAKANMTTGEKIKMQGTVFENPITNTDNAYKALTGQHAEIASPLMAEVESSLKQLATYAYLPKAALAQFEDHAMTKSWAEKWGLSANKFLGIEKGFLKSLLTHNGFEDQAIAAARNGQLMDASFGPNHTVARFGDNDVVGPLSKVLSVGADFVLRATGMTRMQVSLERSVSLALQGHLYNLRDLKFDDLPERVQGNLADNNIDSKLWDEIRSAEIMHVGKVPWLDPTKMSNKASDAYLGMIWAEQKQSVPSPDALIRGTMGGGSASGTLEHATRSIGLQFHSYEMRVLMASIHNTLFNPAINGVLSKTAFASRMVIYTMMAGALTYQLKALADGKDFEDMSEPSFWYKVLTYEGLFGAGRLPDIQEPRYDQNGKLIKAQKTGGADAINALIPPALKPLLTVGNNSINVWNDLKAKDFPGAKKDIGQVLQKVEIAPTFYDMLPIQRLVMDKIEEMTNPNWRTHFANREASLKNTTGQGFWWKSGQNLPDRLPGFAKHPDREK